MKRQFGLKRRKIKIGGNEESYSLPSAHPMRSIGRESHRGRSVLIKGKGIVLTLIALLLLAVLSLLGNLILMTRPSLNFDEPLPLLNIKTTMLQVQVPPLQLQISSEGMINKSISADQINQAVNLRIQHFHEQQRANLLTSSPACYPHFNHYQPNGQWNSTTKFKRIVFYHARKAGGTSTASYLKKVAETHGIDIELQEWRAAEEPGTNKDTFYVTHLREPVDRSISHFKYEGRWSCRALMDKAFVPTKDNAFKLETWNQTAGHSHYNREDECFGTTTLKGPINRNPDPPLDDKWRVHLSECAVNCYTQWFGGLNCARWQVPFEQQYEVALSKLYKYNLIIVIEKLHDPKYAQAIENFFGVEGILKRGVPPCEKQSHKANGDNPLVVHNETRAKLTELNRLDLKLYNEISDCLADGSYEKIPKWDGSRFLLNHSSPSQVRIYNPWWGVF